jgi:hypothetical protein
VTAILVYYFEVIVVLITENRNSASHPGEITKHPNATGRVIGSHIILLFRSMIYDSTETGPKPIEEYSWGGKPLGAWFTKRIFRVVPSDYPRGI